MRTIGIVNEKGGVGKTTTTAQLGRALTALGKNTMAVDMDGQANLSEILLAGQAEDGRVDPEMSVFDLLTREDVGVFDVIRRSEAYGYAVVPSNGDLKTWWFNTIYGERGDADDLRRPVLRSALSDFEAEVREVSGQEIDFCLIDAPPSFGPQLLQVLMASDELLIPVQLEEMSVQGVFSFTRTIKELTKREMAKSKLLGIVPVMVDARKRSRTPEMVAEIEKYFHEAVVPEEARIPISSELEKSADGLTVAKSSNRAVRAYRKLGAWVVAQESHAEETEPVEGEA